MTHGFACFSTTPDLMDVKVNIDGKDVTIRVDADTINCLRRKDPSVIELVMKLAREQLANDTDEEDHTSTEQSEGLADELPDIEEDSSMSATRSSPSPPHSSSDSTATCSWSNESESLLLETFQKLSNSKQLMKSKWKHISKSLEDEGFFFSAEKCRLKVKTLKERHARIQRKRGKSGESPPTDSMEDKLDEVFQNMPDVNPSCIIESGTSEDVKKTHKRPRTGQKQAELKSELMDLLKQSNDDAERRHREKLTVFKQFLDIVGKK
ncbi:uncharacterized protein LOC117324823 [Pecten maximus]|uniref:uncharacterized protein LOC117324823 n=1 Tax=Pecten maximus TaxID=6579 RepID=UPI001458A2D4|nr:uncharacterized protein LOC117324823 [Pecten maximus]